jgi:hypothetical protein
MSDGICFACPVGADCQDGTSLQRRTVANMQTLPGYWRFLVRRKTCICFLGSCLPLTLLVCFCVSDGQDMRINQSAALLQPPLIYPCSLDTAGACLASNYGACMEGYTGPLCAVCKQGYHRSNDNTCDICSANPVASISIFFCIAFLILLLIIFLITRVLLAHFSNAYILSEGDACLITMMKKRTFLPVPCLNMFSFLRAKLSVPPEFVP